MRKLATIISLIGITLTSFHLSAQKSKDLLYLKNGSVIHGILIEHIPGQSYTMQMSDGSQQVYRTDEVQKLATETTKNHLSPTKFNNPKGYFGLTELSLPIRVGAQVVNGYRFCPQFAMGVGIGLMGDWLSECMYIPLYLHLRSDLLEQEILLT